MKTTLCALVLCVFTLPSLASAQDSIQGHWSGELQSDNGAQLVQMAIRVDDDRLSGSIFGNGVELSIQQASIDANVVKFSTTQHVGEVDTKLLWSGTINGDEIAFTFKAEGNEAPGTDLLVKRQAS